MLKAQTLLALFLLSVTPYGLSLDLPPGVAIIGGALAMEHSPRADALPDFDHSNNEEAKYKIMVIIPVVTTKYNDGIEKEIEQVRAPDFHIDYVNLKEGTNFIESRYAEYLDTGSIVELAKEAEKNGYNAIFVTCFGEPGVSVVRELVNIPVIGGFLGGGVTADLISRKFSIVSVVASVVPMLRELADTLGVEGNMTSIRQIDVPVPDLGDITIVEKHLVEQSKAAIEQEGAQAILLGCTGLVGVREYVEEQIQQLNPKNPVPVLAPNQVAIAYLQGMVRMGLTQSRLAFYESHAQPADF